MKQFVEAHVNPTFKTKQIIKEVNEATKVKDFKLKRELKHQLFSFTPAVVILKGQKRKYDNIHSWTGLMQLDFDGMETEAEAIELKRTIFKMHLEVICSYLSPSRLGVKALIKTTVPKDKEHYKALHQAMVNKFEMYSYLDESTKNPMLPLFLSMDDEIEYRGYNDAKVFTDEDWSTPDYVELIESPPTSSYETSGPNLLRTIDIFQKKIRGIMDEGHPQLRSACLILGSRVAAGYITKHDATSMAVLEINNNTYFHKGVLGYLETASWAIEQGTKSPKYYK